MKGYNMITFKLTNLIDGRVVFVSIEEEEYQNKFINGNMSFMPEWYYEPYYEPMTIEE
jgi:hypothetical protein